MCTYRGTRRNDESTSTSNLCAQREKELAVMIPLRLCRVTGALKHAPLHKYKSLSKVVCVHRLLDRHYLPLLSSDVNLRYLDRFASVYVSYAELALTAAISVFPTWEDLVRIFHAYKSRT